MKNIENIIPRNVICATKAGFIFFSCILSSAQFGCGGSLLGNEDGRILAAVDWPAKRREGYIWRLHHGAGGQCLGVGAAPRVQDSDHTLTSCGRQRRRTVERAHAILQGKTAPHVAHSGHLLGL